MITKTVKITCGEPVTVTLLTNCSGSYSWQPSPPWVALDFSFIKDKLPLMHLEVSHASGDPYFSRKDLRRFIKKLQEIDAMWDVAMVQEA
jgi:hypothetical protein